MKWLCLMLSKNFITLWGSGPACTEENLKEFLKYCCYNGHKVKGTHVLHCWVHKLLTGIVLQVTAKKETHSFFNICKFAGISWSCSDAFSKVCFVAHWQTHTGWHVDYFILWVQLNKLDRYLSPPVLPFWYNVTARVDLSSSAKKSTSGASVWKISKNGFSCLATNAKTWNLAWNKEGH